jgi:outer membrane protein
LDEIFGSSLQVENQILATLSNLNMRVKWMILSILFLLSQTLAAQETLTIQEALEMAEQNFGTLKAKAQYAESFDLLTDKARRDYLPNVNLGAQQVYGTVNGQLGPLYGFGLTVASSGLPRDTQSWDAAFGALYLANVNWEVFAFGRARKNIQVAAARAGQSEQDLGQEIFQHKVKVASAYLNLLAARKLTSSFEKNLDRAATFQNIVKTRAKNGLIPGADSSQADAELSNAKIAYVTALDKEQESRYLLSVLTGTALGDFEPDTLFISNIPAILEEIVPASDHPVLSWHQSRIRTSEQERAYAATFKYPAVNLVGVFQSRASGFGSSYNQDPTDFNHEYLTGVKPTRSNYLVGFGLNWNLSQILRVSKQTASQALAIGGLQSELEQASLQLSMQAELAQSKLKNARDNAFEAPVQVNAASQAYQRQVVMYENGLSDLVSVSQALYLLIRAETDLAIANNNVWQALLYQAAAVGDFSLFENQINRIPWN